MHVVIGVTKWALTERKPLYWKCLTGRFRRCLADSDRDTRGNSRSSSGSKFNSSCGIHWWGTTCAASNRITNVVQDPFRLPIYPKNWVGKDRSIQARNANAMRHQSSWVIKGHKSPAASCCHLRRGHGNLHFRYRLDNCSVMGERLTNAINLWPRDLGLHYQEQ